MISEMVKFGTLEREQRYNSTNVYRLTGFSEESTTVVDTESTRGVELIKPLKEDNISSKGTSNDIASFGTSNDTSSFGASNGTKPNLKGFGYFCSLYPRHRLGSVRKLRDLWITCRMEEFGDDIVSALKSFKQSTDWTNEEGKWVPGAYRFLDEERWRVYAHKPSNPLSIYEED
tara:strand:+ start:751 stop:1272 length:522 start_codon:yes stop_codon:yes gene_type:complete